MQFTGGLLFSFHTTGSVNNITFQLDLINHFETSSRLTRDMIWCRMHPLNVSVAHSSIISQFFDKFLVYFEDHLFEDKKEVKKGFFPLILKIFPDLKPDGFLATFVGITFHLQL